MPQPTSQTAAVAEFRCLYTPDVRKKQKKWHDGVLKFHAFNARVMVYDQARNFLGDTYYKDADALHEGDELTLDKGVLVEVADAVGVTQTDLTPLFEKKPPPSAPPRRFQPPSQLARPQPRHRPLSTLLGTPKGPLGKAVPITSPYEARQAQEREKENDFAVDRAAKRQKTAHTAHSSTRPRPLRLSSPVHDSPVPKKSQPARPIPQGAPIITLDDLDAIAPVSSDPSLPGTPPRVDTTPQLTAPPVRPAVVDTPARTPRIPRGKVPVPSVKARETPRAAAPPSSPPVSASNRLTNVDFAIQPTPAKEPARPSPRQPSPPRPLDPPSPPRNPKAKSLRLSRGVKRGKLMMCEPPPPRSRDSVDKVRNLVKARQTSPKRVLDVFYDPEVMHGLMDQQLLVTKTPPPVDPILVPDSPELVIPKPRVAKAARNTRTVTSPRPKETRLEPTSPPVVAAAVTEPTKPPQRHQPPRKPSSSPAVPQALQPETRASSPARCAVSGVRSHTNSLSPQKPNALSTGGFSRKTKRPTPQPHSAAAARTTPIAPPPHPLRATEKAPVMTTTELAATLQNPRNNPRVEGGSGAEPSSRKFRRVRSLNDADAPIPSTSAAWEAQNVKPPPADTVVEVRDKTAPSKTTGLAALIRKTDPRRLARTCSLSLETSLNPLDVTSPLVSPVVDRDIGPWSTEAADLMDWRPPREVVADREVGG